MFTLEVVLIIIVIVRIKYYEMCNHCKFPINGWKFLLAFDTWHVHQVGHKIPGPNQESKQIKQECKHKKIYGVQ